MRLDSGPCWAAIALDELLDEHAAALLGPAPARVPRYESEDETPRPAEVVG